MIECARFLRVGDTIPYDGLDHTIQVRRISMQFKTDLKSVLSLLIILVFFTPPGAAKGVSVPLSPAFSSSFLSVNAATEDNGYATIKGAWNGKDAFLLYAKNNKATILNQEGVNPCLKGTVSFEYKAIASAVQGRNLVFYVIPFTAEGKEGGAARTAWMVPAKTVGDGKWHHASFSYDYSTNLEVVGVQLDQRVNESEETGPGKWLITDIHLKPLPYPTGPHLVIQAFNATQTPLTTGNSFDMALTIQNIGRSAANGIHASLKLSPNLKPLGLMQSFGSLKAGESGTFLWRCKPLRSAGIAYGRVSVTRSLQKRSLDAAWSSVIFRTPPERWGYQKNTLDLRAGSMRVIFPPVNNTGGVYAFASLEYLLNGKWTPFAVLPHIAQVNTRGGSDQSPLAKLVSHTASSARFAISNPNWNADVTFLLNRKLGVISIDASLLARRDLDLMAFRCPDLRIGEGSFGSSKSDAIFPGLEFLSSKQVSSSSEFVNPPMSERWTPHPLRITSPMLSLASHGIVLTLLWNPNAKWDGVHEGYSVQFATPNRPMRQNNSRMALFVPSIPQWVMENGSEANIPYRLKRGHEIRLHSVVFLRSGDSALDGIQTVLHSPLYHPLYAASPRSLQQEIDLSAKCFMKTLWRGPDKGWKGQDNTNPAPNAGIAIELLKIANETNNPLIAVQAKQQVEEVMNRFHMNQGDVTLALWKGGVQSALNAAQGGAEAKMQTQRADGTWGFAPDTPEREKLGPRGDTNVGICSTNLGPIAAYALITRNPAAVRSLLKALKAMERFRIPAGAQVWECPLQEPDILAAANVIPEYVDGYLITGDKQYLRRAAYWAWTGVPFVYQWRYPNRAIMPGATTPVFGSSFFTWSWMGRPVQWNGLAYAHALLTLAPYDHSFDWTQLAASITHCGMQEQQLHSSSSNGCYPDSFHLLSNKPFGPWLNPGVIMNNLFHIKEGMFAYPNTIAIRDGSRRWLVTSGEPCEGEANHGEITLTVKPIKAITSRLIVSSPSRPSSIELNGSPLKQVENERSGGSWWLWDATENVILIQVRSTAPFRLRL